MKGPVKLLAVWFGLAHWFVSDACRRGKTVLHAIVQCPGVLKICTEHQLSSTRRIQLLSESILKFDPPDFLTKEGMNCILVVVANAKEAIWRMKMKGIMTGNFISDPGLERYFAFH